MIRFLTAGESHGRWLVAVVEGLPAGLRLRPEAINAELARRQMGYGRGARMAIERDRAEIVSGVRFGETLGSPVSLLIPNKDWENWQEAMAIEVPHRESPALRRVLDPRPGHADLAGTLKYLRRDARDVLERASARETAARVAVGACAKALLAGLGACVESHAIQLGGITSPSWLVLRGRRPRPGEINRRADRSPVRCLSAAHSREMVRLVDRARETGDTLGGVFEIVATGLPVGLGSYVQWDRRADARLARALLSIPAIKGMEVGEGFAASALRGSQVHDAIYYSPRGRQATGGFYRRTNRAGGIEGGITTGEPLILRAAMKPLSTLRHALRTVNLATGEVRRGARERSDVTALPAAGIVGEAVVAIELANLYIEKFGGDSLAELKRNWRSYLAEIARRRPRGTS